jgi:ATP-dependent DNA helicase RecG
LQYDDWVLREIINNCIAHQDYRLGGNVRVTEYEDKIEFLNSGYFIPETIEAVVLQDFIPPTNRNQCLVSAMCEVNMIDSITSGIQRIYQIQRKKGFPLPTYTLKDGQVKVTIDGKILNENYTKLLFSQADLDLDTVFLLDKVQKNIKIAKEDSDILHKKGLVEGRYPHLFVASEIAEQVDQKQDYIKNKAFDNKYYKDFIYEYFKRYKKATFNEIFKLVEGKMSDVLNKEQKIRKTKYLLTRLKDEGKIRVEGNTKTAVWVLSK